jgi:hypothetical protein
MNPLYMVIDEVKLIPDQVLINVRQYPHTPYPSCLPISELKIKFRKKNK